MTSTLESFLDMSESLEHFDTTPLRRACADMHAQEAACAPLFRTAAVPAVLAPAPLAHAVSCTEGDAVPALQGAAAAASLLPVVNAGVWAPEWVRPFPPLLPLGFDEAPFDVGCTGHEFVWDPSFHAPDATSAAATAVVAFAADHNTAPLQRQFGSIPSSALFRSRPSGLRSDVTCVCLHRNSLLVVLACVCECLDTVPPMPQRRVEEPFSLVLTHETGAIERESLQKVCVRPHTHPDTHNADL